MVNLKEIPTEQALEEIAKRYSSLKPRHLTMMMKLFMLVSELEKTLEHHFSRFGLSRGRYLLLLILHWCPEKKMSPSDLADKLDVTRGNMTGLIDGLEKAGLIRRAECKNDRRGIFVAITEKGKEKIEEVLPVHYKRLGKFLEGVTQDEASQMIHMMNKLHSRMDILLNPEE